MAEDESTESVPLLRPESPSQKTKGALTAARRWVTVEPVITGTALMIGIMATVQTQYFRYYFSKKYNRTEADNSTHCHAGNGSDDMPDPIERLIQESVSMWVTYYTICTKIACIPTAFVLCCYSDRIGRKLPMTVAIVGALANAAISFAAIWFELPLYVFLIGALASSFTGGSLLPFTACLAYIADFTTEKNRMIHFVIAEIIIFIWVGFPQVTLGYIIEDLGGYSTPYAISIVVAVVTLGYIWVPQCLPETVRVDPTRSGTPVRDALRAVYAMLNTLDGGRRQRMAFYLFLFVFFMVIGFGVASLQTVLVYVMGAPFCLETTELGFYTFTVFIVSGIGCMIGGALLPLCLSVFGLLYLSFISTQLFFIGMALAEDTLFLYIAAVIGSLRLLAGPVCRTATSKMVKPTEQGTLFSIIGTLNNLAEFVFPVFLQAVYTSTLSVDNRIVFYLGAGLIFIPLVATIVLQCISREPITTMVIEEDCFQKSDEER